MKQNKIAIINDISGFGRCSIAVILPIISHLGIQGCPVPTAIFSNHTGFESFFRLDFTRYMDSYINEWKKLGLSFDGIMTGFLGSHKQIGICRNFIEYFKGENTIVIVDPVMGDNGKIYSTYTPTMCKAMKKLIENAHIITPNLTEACFLTNTKYKPSDWKHQELNDMIFKLRDLGAKQIVITGIRIGSNFIGNAIMNEKGEVTYQRQQIIERIRSGTGDVFASVLAADAVNKIDFETSVRRASNFVRQSLLASEKFTNQTARDGICFETALRNLKIK